MIHPASPGVETRINSGDMRARNVSARPGGEPKTDSPFTRPEPVDASFAERQIQTTTIGSAPRRRTASQIC